MPHKFAAGQTVEYFAADGRFGGAGRYTIIRLLPEDAGEYQYHVQRTGGGEQRCVREAQLRSAGPPIPPASQQSDRAGHTGGVARRYHRRGPLSERTEYDRTRLPAPDA